MKTGMLWFDSGERSLQEKIMRAAAHYRQKYGHSATVCYVNPSETLTPNLPLRVEYSATVLKNHYWLGVDI